MLDLLGGQRLFNFVDNFLISAVETVSDNTVEFVVGWNNPLAFPAQINQTMENLFGILLICNVALGM